MTTDTIILIIAIIVMLIGLAGTIIPFLPDVLLVFLGIAGYGWYEGFHQITHHYLLILAGLTLLSVFVSYPAAVLGAKKFGSSRAGMWGAVAGMVGGIFIFPPLGILAGAFLGAMIGEYIKYRDIYSAAKAGLGTIIGLFSGMIFNLALATAMIISFLIKVF